MPKTTQYKKLITKTLTLDTSAYADGDQFGSVVTIENALLHEVGRAILHSITIIDLSGNGPVIDFLFFNETPTLISSDNDPFSISASELSSKCIGDIRCGQYHDYGGKCVSTYEDAGFFFQGSDANERTTNIYFVPVIREAATFGASDMTVKFGIFQD